MQAPSVSSFSINLLEQATEMYLFLKLRNMRESFCYGAVLLKPEQTRVNKTKAPNTKTNTLVMVGSQSLRGTEAELAAWPH